MQDTTSPFLEWLISLSPAFIIGLAIGYFIKKAFKIFLFVFGAVAVTALVLNSQGIVDLSLDSLQPVAAAGKDSFVWLGKLAEEGLGKMTTQAASGLAGLALGLKMG